MARRGRVALLGCGGDVGMGVDPSAIRCKEIGAGILRLFWRETVNRENKQLSMSISEWVRGSRIPNS